MSRALPASSAGLLLAGLAAAVALRVAVGGGAVAQSTPAGLVFIAALLCLVLAAGWRPGPIAPLSVGIGLIGGAGLVAAPIWMHLHAPAAPGLPLGDLPLWAMMVTIIAVSEEVVLRGALFTAVETAFGTLYAVAVSTIAFALIHVPLYGWGALPLDLTVGVWLGGLRVLTGGVAAPAIAHTLADLAVWWLL